MNAAVSDPTAKVVEIARGKGVIVLTRSQWGSNPDGRRWPLAPDVADVYQWRRENKPHSLIPERPVGTAWQHITDTFDTGQLVGDFVKDMQTVERIGFQRFGSGMSYNFAVDMATGMIGVGQPLDAKGTHTVMRVDRPGFSYDQNKVAVAIAVLGRCDAPLSRDAERSIVILLWSLFKAGYLVGDFDYKGHNFADPGKSCPCPNTQNRMDEIYMATQKEINTPDPTHFQSAHTLLEAARVQLWKAQQRNTGARKAAAAAGAAGIRAIQAALPKR